MGGLGADIGEGEGNPCYSCALLPSGVMYSTITTLMKEDHAILVLRGGFFM